MKFGMLDEGALRQGVSVAARYGEVVDRLVAAERSGFDVFGMAEQHFLPELGGILPGASVGAPEVFYGLACGVTETIRLRSSIAVLPFHHPLTTAERYATVDILSGGRFEFGTGKGNSYVGADAFEVALEETEERWHEGLEVILAAWMSGDELEWHGKYYNIPPRAFRPKPLQRPHPPLLYAALSPRSHELAGELGMGLITSTFGIPLSKAAQRVATYRSALEHAHPLAGSVNNYVCLSILGHCAETDGQARREAEEALINYCLHATGIYEQTLSRVDPSIDFSGVRDRYQYEPMLDNTIILSGTPELWVKKIQEIQETLNVDEVSINFAGIDHAAVMRAITLIGEEVIPHFK